MKLLLARLKEKDATEDGNTLFLFLVFVAIVIFVSSLSYFSDDLFQENIGEVSFLFLTTFLNPFYILLFFFPFLYLLFRIFPRVVFKCLLFLLVGTLFTYLFIEKQIYSQFKFHINSFIIKILRQKGALQVLGIGVWEIIGMILVVAAGFLLSWAIYSLISKSNIPIWWGMKLKGKIRKIAFILLILIVYLSDKTTFAWFLFNKKPTVYLLSQKVPLYIPAQGGKVFKDLGFDVPESKMPSIKFSRKQVRYPLQPFKSSNDGTQTLPNIILLMSDALRPDMISPEIMPKTHQFKEEKTESYENHYSGSNGTSQALFTMFYGLPSRYMDFFSRAEVSPVLIDALLANNYRLELLSSKSLGWLGTDQVVFFKVRDHVKDELDHDSIKSDMMVTDLAIKTLDDHNQNDSRPLFMMLFLDATHLPHFRHKKYKKFQPDKTSIIFDPSNSDDLVGGFNQYKNACNFADHMFDKVLKKLEQIGYLENSVIYITSDHGSEKYEHGHWGHASAFTNEQLIVPSLLYYPGSRPKKIHRMTSHADISVTFLEFMGETYKPEFHSLGQSLFNLTPREYIIADGLANRVLIDESYKIDYTPFEGISYYKVTRANDQPVNNRDEIIALYTPKILRMFDDFQKFLK